MKKRMICLILLIAFIMLLGSNYSIYAEDLEISEYSKKYQEYLELSDEEKEGIIPPFPSNIRNEKQNIFARFGNLVKSVTIPSKYDLREHINVEVKNQRDTGSCWAFSANSSLETYLALHGKEYNFSERHVEYDTAKNFTDGKREEALFRDVGQGGYSSTAFTYYSRGSGPILEEDMPFINDENPIRIAELPKNVTIQKVDNMVYFPNIYKRKDDKGKLIYEDGNGDAYTKQEVLEIRNEIKKHIMNYGGISIAIYAPGDFYNPYTYADNCNEEIWTNHAVTIIGWDDNYGKNNFVTQPSENGAYIVLNSWGDDWGDNGVYYISYEDFYVESQMRGVTGISDVEYDNLYQHDTSEMWTSLEAQYAANVFTSSEDEVLKEVMIGSLSNQTCDVYINTSSDDLNINHLTKIASNVELRPGYNTVKVNSNIELSGGNKFAIVVKLTSDTWYGIGIEDNSAYFGNAKSNPQESFASRDGINWDDMYENFTMNFSIKAYTQTKEKSFTADDVQGEGYDNIGGTFQLGVSSSYIEKGKDITVTINKGTQDITNRFHITGNTIRGKGAYIKIQCPSDIEAGDYAVSVGIPNYAVITKNFTVQRVNNTDYIEIQFEDEAFYHYIGGKIATGFRDDINLKIITPQSEISQITQMWDAYGKNIKDITGIEYFTNLTMIDLNYNDITDFSPISDLKKVEELYLMQNSLDSLQILKNMKNLKILNLGFMTVNNQDISILSNFKNLSDLCLTGWNQVDESDLVALKDLTNLETLGLDCCNIGNIEGLSSLTNLRRLFLNNSTRFGGNNHITDISPIEDMEMYFDMSYQKIDKQVLRKENIELPPLFQDALDSSSKVYSESGISLLGCTWNEYGKSINMDSDYARVEILDGKAYLSRFSIILANSVLDISIEKYPIKLEYNEEEKLDLTGGILQVTLEDGTTDQIDMSNSDVEVSGYDPFTVGEQTVTITYGGKSITIQVTVKARSEEDEDLLGDINKDGVVDAFDAAMIPKHVVGKRTLTTEEMKVADTNNDRTVDAFDAAMILKYVVGKITSF